MIYSVIMVVIVLFLMIATIVNVLINYAILKMLYDFFDVINDNNTIEENEHNGGNVTQHLNNRLNELIKR